MSLAKQSGQSISGKHCVFLTLNTLTVPPVPSWMIPFELVEMALFSNQAAALSSLAVSVSTHSCSL